jgi:IstB-like ATP binding protein
VIVEVALTRPAVFVFVAIARFVMLDRWSMDSRKGLASGTHAILMTQKAINSTTEFRQRTHRSKDNNRLTRVIQKYGRNDLLAIDELGYVHLDQQSAELFFQILTSLQSTHERHGRLASSG